MRADKGRVREGLDENGKPRIPVPAPKDGILEMSDEEFWGRVDKYQESRKEDFGNGKATRKGRITLKEFK